MRSSILSVLVTRKCKSEAVMTVDKNGQTADDRELKRDIDWVYKSTINSAKRKNPVKSKNMLNKLKMGSHKMGATKDIKYVEGKESTNGMPTENNVDSIMGIASEPQRGGEGGPKEKTTYGKQVIGYRESSFLARDEEIEWIVMTEIDYESQLVIALPPKDRPKKVIRAAGKVMLDPQIFVGLVKKQEDLNQTKLLISFERNFKAIKNTGNLNVIVQNPKNPNHEYSRNRDSASDGQDWTTREMRGSREPQRGGV